MKLLFKQLQEKLIQDPRIDYLENPTLKEIVTFAKQVNAQYPPSTGGIRIITFNENIYVWDAHKYIHNAFISMMFGKEHEFMYEVEGLGYVQFRYISKSVTVKHIESQSLMGNALRKKYPNLIQEIWKALTPMQVSVEEVRRTPGLRYYSHYVE